MAESNGIAEETTRLTEFLSFPDLNPLIIEKTLKGFSDTSKNELVASLARTFNPPPSGRLLMRLLYIRTAENEADMKTLYIANLGSPQADARAASLHGLNETKHPLVFDFALSALRDDSNQVLFAACNILLPKAKEDPNIRKLLQEVHASHVGDPAFHMTTNLLEAHSIL